MSDVNTPKAPVSIEAVQCRIARLPPSLRRSNVRRVRLWKTTPLPVARVKLPYTNEAVRAVNEVAWLPHGAGMGFGGDVAYALKVALRTDSPHARFGYVRVAREGEEWAVFVAPKMTRELVSKDGVKWHLAPVE